ncbi:MAG: EamA family transporter [Oscillospiraceae bacterium]|nr:EamA family transporter [Candidatus Limimonas coprohippi]
MSFSYLWPITVLILSNVLYQVTAKKLPEQIDTFIAMVITYLIAAVCSLVLYFTIGNKEISISQQLTHVNWATILLGFSVIGLEVGAIFAYKAGWEISVLSIAQSAVLAIILIMVGYFFFNESITSQKIIGILICLVGLYFINK